MAYSSKVCNAYTKHTTDWDSKDRDLCNTQIGKSQKLPVALSPSNKKTSLWEICFYEVRGEKAQAADSDKSRAS